MKVQIQPIHPDKITQAIATLIRKYSKHDLTGPEKARLVVREAAKIVDAWIKLPEPFETMDGPVIRLLLTSLVQGVYARMKEAGEV